MNCDASSLMEAAKCFRCIPKGLLQSVKTWLLCQWLKKKDEPVNLVIWAPETANMDWTDSGGRHTGNLATFNSTADYSTVASIQLSIGPNITSFSGILYLPLLNYVDFSGNNISVDVVNDILVGLAINGLLNGYVDLSGQTPAAPPSVGPPDGIAAKAYLSSLLGWTISTD